MNIILHIGMQRTGTTFLQNSIFPNIQEVNLANFYRHDGIKFDMLGREDVQSILTNIEKYEYNTVYKKIYRHFQDDKINLISNENIYCEMWTKKDKRVEKIEKTKEFFPNAKIIFGIRDKRDLLLSWYKKYVVNGGTLSFQDFKQVTVNIDKFDYGSYTKYLLELFGKENVYIYRFEEMKRDIYSFVNGICNFMGVDSPNFKNKKWNVGYSLWQLKTSLILNHFFKTSLNPEGVIPLEYKWHPHRIIFQSPFFPRKLRGKKITINDLKKEC